MKLANPNINKPFDHVYKDKELELYGERTVDGEKELVNLKTGESNMQYHQPEIVTHYDNCQHNFHIIDVGKRELECSNCHYETIFNPATNYREQEGKGYIRLKSQEYQIFL